MNSLRAIIPWSLFLLLPIALIVDPHLPYPHIFPKNLYFRAIVPILMALAFLDVQSIVSKIKLRFKVFAGLLLFIGACYLSSLLGVNFHFSFWSSLERSEGLINLTFLACTFCLFYIFFEKKHWKWWFFSQVIVGLLVVLWGMPSFIQGLNSTKFYHLTSTLGNRSYFATFVLFSTFAALILLKSGDLSRRLRIFLISVIPLFILSIFMTTNRGALLGLVLGGVVYVAMSVRTGSLKDFNWRKWTLIGGAGLIVLAIGLGVLSKTTPYLNRFTKTTGTENTRFLMWGVSLKSMLDRPLLGTGYRTFESSFDRYYPKSYPKNEEWVDNAHSIFFELLSTTGLVGLGFFIYFLFQAAKGFERKNALAYAILTACLVEQFFLINPTESQILFYSFLAYFIRPDVTEVKQESWLAKYGKGLSVVSIIIAGYFIYSHVWFEFRNARAYIETVSSPKLNLKEKTEGIKKILQGESVYVHSFRLSYAHTLAMLRRELKTKLRPFKHIFISVLDPVYEDTLKQYGHTTRDSTLFAQAYYYNGQFGKGLQLINQSIEEAPFRAKNYIHRAAIYRTIGQQLEAYQDYIKAHELDPNYQRAKLLLADVAYQRGNVSYARSLLGDKFEKRYKRKIKK